MIHLLVFTVGWQGPGACDALCFHIAVSTYRVGAKSPVRLSDMTRVPMFRFGGSVATKSSPLKNPCSCAAARLAK